ncbi:glucose-6-phosphate exchanger SLC37A4-like [Mya arenaria]|uniref:glucose-6-phosphate exchanger SLC37A4-like n=1 Tax=Mya arenaria TaxID=6604 RepID=UPI0022E1F3B4|nr:glucose-6-phosphate exchanger SLC37A4-like [Mya arenaria]
MNERIIFGSLYVSYMLNVYCKRSVTFALPEIAKTEGIDKDELGIILSSQLLAYTVGKFASGILLDFVRPRILLSISLIAVGVTVILFASVPSNIWLLTVIWILNGLACSPGWPASALIMRRWFREDQFGTAWSMLSTSMNLAGFVGPLITAFISTYSGWRSSLTLPGFIIMGYGCLVLIILKDAPVSSDASGDKKKSSGDFPTVISRWDLFKLPGYLGVCTTYFIISLLQFGTIQWQPVHLVNELGHNIIVGNSYISSLEVGGICGSILAGYYSDSLLTKWSEVPNQVVRQHVIAWFSSGLAIFLCLITYCITQYSSMVWITLIGFGMGITLYGPISILGLTAMECAPTHMAGTAHAVSCLFANFGQTMAGFPLSYAVTWLGWQSTSFLQMIIVILMVVYLFFCTTMNKKQASKQQKRD